MIYFSYANKYLFEAGGGAERAEQLRVTGTSTPAEDEEEEKQEKYKKKKKKKKDMTTTK